MTTDFNGYWKMLSNDNFEEYLKGLGIVLWTTLTMRLSQSQEQIARARLQVMYKLYQSCCKFTNSIDVSGSDVNVALRKIATLLKPDKDIIQNGDHMVIKTLSTFRNYIMDFDVGKEFEEDLSGVDDRKCMTTVSWEDNKLVCVQKGEKEGRGWTQWVEGDELHLEMRVGDAVCKQVFKKVR